MGPALTACENPTCDRQVQYGGRGRPTAFCSRLCQVAMLRNRGRWSVRVNLPARLAHRLLESAEREGTTVEALVLTVIEDEMRDRCRVGGP